MSRDEVRIRELAYQIWESEGCPEGQAARHWEMACVLAEPLDGPPSALPVTRPRPVTRPTPVERDVPRAARNASDLQPTAAIAPARPKS